MFDIDLFLDNLPANFRVFRTYLVLFPEYFWRFSYQFWTLLDLPSLGQDVNNVDKCKVI